MHPPHSSLFEFVQLDFTSLFDALRNSQTRDSHFSFRPHSSIPTEQLTRIYVPIVFQGATAQGRKNSPDLLVILM